MNDMASFFGNALTALMTLSSGSLSYLSGSTTVSASVYKSFMRDYTREMEVNNYQQQLDNMYVIATPSDVSSWGLIPQQSNVDLDGTKFTVGQTINKTAGYWTIWLRLRTDRASGQ